MQARLLIHTATTIHVYTVVRQANSKTPPNAVIVLIHVCTSYKCHSVVRGVHNRNTTHNFFFILQASFNDNSRETMCHKRIMHTIVVPAKHMTTAIGGE